MSLEIIPLVLGPVGTNAYLVADQQTKSAVVLDPAWDGELILQEANRRGWVIEQIWLTHAHFYHIGGIAGLLKGMSVLPSIALHPADLPLYKAGGALFSGCASHLHLSRRSA
jgi:glyoxylase-like metal-dependent hydrolase (beta-lactamase superfamily II)